MVEHLAFTQHYTLQWCTVSQSGGGNDWEVKTQPVVEECGMHNITCRELNTHLGD